MSTCTLLQILYYIAYLSPSPEVYHTDKQTIEGQKQILISEGIILLLLLL